jgi:hypothetical protein
VGFCLSCMVLGVATLVLENWSVTKDILVYYLCYVNLELAHHLIGFKAFIELCL